MQFRLIHSIQLLLRARPLLLALLLSSCSNIASKIPSLNLLGSKPIVLAAASSAAPSSLTFYLANFSKNQVENFSLTYSTGATAQVSTFATCQGPNAVVIHPNGGFLYVPCQTDGAISQFSIHSKTLELTALAPLASGSPTLKTFTINPAGTFAYATDGTPTLLIFSIDATTGLLTKTSTFVMADASVQAMRIHPSGKFLYTANFTLSKISVFQIDATTGALTPSGTNDTGIGPTALATDTTGAFVWVANYTDNSISSFAVNSSTGALTALPGAPLTVAAHPLNLSYGLSVGSVTSESFTTGKLTGGGATTLYLASDTPAIVQTLPIAATGLPTVVQSMNTAAVFPNSSVITDPTGAYVLSAGNGITVYKADSTTGQLTFTVHEDSDVAGPASIVFSVKTAAI